MFNLCKNSLSLTRIAIILILSITLVSCGGGGGGGNNPQNSTSKELTAFSFSAPSSTGIIDQDAKTVLLTVPFGTDVSALKAVFTTTGVKTTVDDVEQESGVTENNFTGNVTYRVHAEDGSYTDYFVTVKTSWAKVLGGTGYGYGCSICTDSSGNVYAAGLFDGTINLGNGDVASAGGYDIFIVKYSYDGTPGWIKTIGSTDDDESYSICTDSSDNIYVTGRFGSTVNFGDGNVTSKGYSDIFIVKYSADGTCLWSKTIGGTSSEIGYSIYADNTGTGYIYVTGEFSGTVNFGGGDLKSTNIRRDCFIAKYASSDGAYIWAKKIGGSGSDLGISVCSDHEGNVLLAGYFENTVDPGNGTEVTSKGGVDTFVVKYASSDGAYIWVRTIGGTGGEYGNMLRVDSSGNVYLTGTFSDTTDFGNGDVETAGLNDIFIVKYASSDGAYVWARTIGGTDYDQGFSICMDPMDSLYVTGAFSYTVNFGSDSATSIGETDLFIMECTQDGSCSLLRTIGGTGVVEGISALDNSGNIYTRGQFSGTVNLGEGDVTCAGGSGMFIIRN